MSKPEAKDEFKPATASSARLALISGLKPLFDREKKSLVARSILAVAMFAGSLFLSSKVIFRPDFQLASIEAALMTVGILITAELCTRLVTPPLLATRRLNTQIRQLELEEDDRGLPDLLPEPSKTLYFLEGMSLVKQRAEDLLAKLDPTTTTKKLVDILNHCFVKTEIDPKTKEAIKDLDFHATGEDSSLANPAIMQILLTAATIGILKHEEGFRHLVSIDGRELEKKFYRLCISATNSETETARKMRTEFLPLVFDFVQNKSIDTGRAGREAMAKAVEILRAPESSSEEVGAGAGAGAGHGAAESTSSPTASVRGASISYAAPRTKDTIHHG